jgi:hypothetical protein
LQLQSFKPINRIHCHLCAFHFYAYDMSRQVEAHHYCMHYNQDMRQCAIFDSPEADAGLIGWLRAAAAVKAVQWTAAVKVGCTGCSSLYRLRATAAVNQPLHNQLRYLQLQFIVTHEQIRMMQDTISHYT